MMPTDPDDQADVEFTCPRCATAARARFYGPCQSCRSSLASTYGGPGRQIDVGRFEPAMHVVPNQIATKD